MCLLWPRPLRRRAWALAGTTGWRCLRTYARSFCDLIADTKLANTIARCRKLLSFGGRRDSGGANRRSPRTGTRVRERIELAVASHLGFCRLQLLLFLKGDHQSLRLFGQLYVPPLFNQSQINAVTPADSQATPEQRAATIQ